MKNRLQAPVPIMWKGRPRSVSSVLEAAEMLVDPCWPVRGRRHRLACKAVAEWSERPSEIRLKMLQEALRDAASEAGILISTSIH